jgi:hypothetical protein
MGPLSRATRRWPYLMLALAAVFGISGKDASATDVNFVSNTAVQQFNNDCSGTLRTVASLNFSVMGASEILVLFNGECTVAAPDDSTSLNISIRVDNVLLAPTNNFNNAFCTSTGDNMLQHWVSAETNGARSIGAGTHTVVVQGRLLGCTTTDDWQVDDVSLIVIESP